MTDVYIAEGHGRRPDGTFDPGATDGTHTEQRDSKPVAEACTARLRAAGLEVISESDQADDPNFYGTTQAANEAGVKCVVSFHYDWNQAPPGAFMIATTDDGRELGRAIEARVQEAGFDIRDYPDDRDGLYLLDNSNAPAVIFECGRIGHDDIDEEHEQRAMGEAAARGILDWLDHPIKEDLMLEIGPDSPKEDIRLIQGLVGVEMKGEWTPETVVAVSKKMGKYTNHPEWKMGEAVGGAQLSGFLRSRMWTRSQIAAIAAASAGAGLTMDDVFAAIRQALGG